MSNELTNTKNQMDEFRERVTEKLKHDIGEMLPDNVLEQLTQRAVDEQFFKEREVVVNPGSWSSKTEKRPSWFVEEVGKIAEPIIREAIEKFIDKHIDDIESAINKYVSEQNLTITASAMVASQMSSHMYTNVDMIVQSIMNHPGRM